MMKLAQGNRVFHVAFDGQNSIGQANGDLSYVTGPEGMSHSHLDIIKAHLKTREGGNFYSVRISFFAEIDPS